MSEIDRLRRSRLDLKRENARLRAELAQAEANSQPTDEEELWEAYSAGAERSSELGSPVSGYDELHDDFLAWMDSTGRAS